MEKKFKSNDKLLDSLSVIINNFSTPLVNIIYGPENQKFYKLQGSGTFVRIDNLFGILTAYHVAHELKFGSAIGLNIYSDEKGQNFSFPKKDIIFIDIAKPIKDNYGPDISFLRLPNTAIGMIKANKSFYDLSIHQNNYQTYIKNIENHKRYVSWGVPGELNTIEPAERGFENVMGFHGYCMASLMKNYITKGNHDYIDFDIDFNFTKPDFPKNLGGVSGGGIWMIDTNVDIERKEINLSDFSYCGINFFQTEITDDNHRLLRGHAWKSIYSVAYQSIIDNFK